MIHVLFIKGNSGCLASSRHVMRILVGLAQLRSEHKKPGRDQFIAVNPANVESRTQPYNPLNVYDSNKVIHNPQDFDFNSITLIDQTAYSGNGAPVVQSRVRPFLNNGVLSMKDCQAIAFANGGTCNPQTCADRE